MLQRIVSWPIVLLLLCFAACDEPPPIIETPGPPPSQVTSVPHVGQEQMITIVVDSVTPLRSGESGPNDLTEFRLVMLVADSEGHSNGIYCPDGDALTLTAGQTVVENPCAVGLAFNESTVGERFYLLFIAVDEDELSIAEDLGIDAGIGMTAWALLQNIEKAALLPKAASPVLAVGELVLGLAGEKAVDYFQQEDIISQQGFVLFRDYPNPWGAGYDNQLLAHDGGMKIAFHTVRMSTANSGQPIATVPSQSGALQVLVADSPATELPATAVPTPTGAPPTPIPQRLDRLVLVDSSGRELMTLQDGATIDLSRLGSKYLDVRAEANSAAVGSVAFLLDGQPFCINGPCVENAPPYIMGGDLSGELYGNWDWLTVIGRHTVAAYACTQANASGECSKPLSAAITVQR